MVNPEFLNFRKRGIWRGFVERGRSLNKNKLHQQLVALPLALVDELLQ